MERLAPIVLVIVEFVGRLIGNAHHAECIGAVSGPIQLTPTLERASQVPYRPLRLMGFNMHEKLTALSKRLKDEQRQLLLSAAEQNALPSASTI